jgi:hypothetical protein
MKEKVVYEIGEKFQWPGSRVAEIIFIDIKSDYISLSIPPMKTLIGVNSSFLKSLKLLNQPHAG